MLMRARLICVNISTYMCLNTKHECVNVFILSLSTCPLELSQCHTVSALSSSWFHSSTEDNKLTRYIRDHSDKDGRVRQNRERVLEDV